MLALVNTPSAPIPVELNEVPEPVPQPDEAIVEVHAFSLNRGELALLASRPQGWRPGQDVAGVIVQPAADGSGPDKGTRVVAWVDGAGWSQRVAAPTARIAALPDNVSFASAATLPVAGVTALRALRQGGFLLGQRVLITGAAGGVGRFAVQLATLAGAEVTGVVSSSDRAAGLTELGATALVPNVREADGLFDLILESVGGASLSGAISKVAPGGTIVVFGNSSREETSISFSDFAGHAFAHIIPFFVYLSGTPASMGEDLAKLVSMVASGKLKPEIGLEDSWHNVYKAAAALRDRKVNGKAVFHVQ
ncbi:MAG TPA: zinc-binding dehydrogenase [Ktedonobacteraceae bacterium]|nr:zinc-binding dehydrogenase [Ktedonobacteraceae bacterium]